MQELKQNILKMFLSGKSQTEIFDELKESSKIKPKKLQTLIRENAFLSPKNFKYGSVLVFFVGYLTPVFAIYMKGYEYNLLIKPIFILSLILSVPFIVFAILFYFNKDLKRISNIAVAFLIYYLIYIITFLSVAADIRVWTIVLFPIVIFPTMLVEWIKLQVLVKELNGSDASN